MTPIVLTAHQTEAVEFLTDHLHAGDPIVALRGLAGTGKTSLIPALIAVLEGTGIPVTLGAPTHRAAMILKKKGLTQADTVHAHALTPYFSGDYTRAIRWLGGSCQCRIEDLANAQAAIDGIPWLVAERLKIVGVPPETVKARAKQHEPRRALESIGLTGRKHFAGFGPKEGEGVLIIDEASMVGAKMLALCQEAFPQICLVGDPGQLPPVQDKAMLAEVPGFELTEVHRQAKDSKIIQLAYAARYGEKFWDSIPFVAGEVEEYRAIDARVFLHSPLIVWRNTPREECTHAIRKELGYPPDALTVGEPLVCRATDARSRADGFFNNAMFRVIGVSDNPRQVLVKADGQDDAEEHEVLVHMEELHGDNIDPEAILFRFGYCLTAHTAQGGEWPTVYISKPELFAHSRRKVAEAEVEAAEAEFRQWSYTAITRAKQTLAFVRKHDFTTTASVAPAAWVLPPIGDEMPKMQQTPNVAPPSAPMMQSDPYEPDDIPEPILPPGLADEAMASPVPGLPLSQEIGPGYRPLPAIHSAEASATTGPEPLSAQIPTAASTTAVVPANGTVPPDTLPAPLTAAWAQHEALLQGFCGALQGQMSRVLTDEAIRLTKQVDETLTRVFDYMKGRLEANEHAEYSFADALLQVREKGLTLHGSPYEMALTVYSPAGVPLTLTVRKTTPAALLDELTRLETWLAMNGYTGEKPAGVAA